jgi:hypothetical protein
MHHHSNIAGKWFVYSIYLMTYVQPPTVGKADNAHTNGVSSRQNGEVQKKKEQ